MKHQLLKLTLVTNSTALSIEPYLKFISVCASSGITCVQLREKEMPIMSLFKFGQRIKSVLAPFRIPLIVNDNIDLCAKLDAQGVHLGQTDGDVKIARQILGAEKIIGLSVNNFDQIERANRLPVDYLGVGTIFPTDNKSNIQTVWGLGKLEQAVSMSKHPIVAIGGINESNANSVMSSGADGIAAIAAFHEASDLQTTVQALRKITEKELRCDR